ncbi:CRISPR-associated endonuclease Cas1 [Nocardia puris]|uniref:CRISPR-associated endonuclease Cas1 n=1 Tax=Nocardia puris TaxID=208602 RepID=UPI002E1EA8A6
MVGALLAGITADSNLLEAWNVTLSRLPEEPVPHEEVARFTGDLLANLAEIGSALRDGAWQPGPLRRAAVPKRDGGQRILHIPPLADRVAERAIAAVITPWVDPHLQPDSYGFRPGLGVDDAVEALRDRVEQGERWVIRTDISECFASIPVEECLAEIAPVIGDPDVLELLARAARRSVGDRPGRGLAQGAPLSPLLVNFYLDQFDRDGWSEGVSVIRYVDDIAVAATARGEAERQLGVLRRCARRRGLALSPGKTRIVNARDGVEYLGRIVRADGRRRVAPLTDPARATLYVLRRGAAVRASGTRFLVTGNGKNFRHPASRTRMIICGDRVLITSAALGLAARSGVGLVMVDAYHDHSVFLSPNTGRHEVLRAQYAAESDAEHSLLIAATMVRGKIANSRILLTRTKSRRLRLDDRTVRHLDRLRDHSAAATTVAGLHGIEGAASRIYFHALGALIAPEWRFGGRTRRPPRDPVNAMLSYGYTILAAEARRAVELAGLDPTRGFLHTAHRRRPSLALDLMEEFRAPLIDSTVLRLLNTRAVQPSGFSAGGGGCRMDARTKRVLIDELERRMLTRITHPISRKPIAYRECLHEQALLLASSLAGRGAYTPMPWR